MAFQAPSSGFDDQQWNAEEACNLETEVDASGYQPDVDTPAVPVRQKKKYKPRAPKPAIELPADGSYMSMLRPRKQSDASSLVYEQNVEMHADDSYMSTVRPREQNDTPMRSTPKVEVLADESYMTMLRPRKQKFDEPPRQMQMVIKYEGVSDTNPASSQQGVSDYQYIDYSMEALEAKEEYDEELVEYNYGPTDVDAAKKVPARAVVGGIIRAPRSLLTLAGRFIEYLHSTPAGIIDLTEVQHKLRISNRRRVYDVTNVLQGIGLAEKQGLNRILWKGGQSSIKLRPEQRQYMDQLETEITELERDERLLEDHIRWLKQSIRNVCDDDENRKLLYSRQNEIIAAFSNSLLIGFKTPANTAVEVKNTDKFELRLMCPFAPIEMRSINNDIGATDFWMDQNIDESNSLQQKKEHFNGN